MPGVVSFSNLMLRAGLMCADEIVAAADAIAAEAKKNLDLPSGKVPPNVPGRGPLDMTAAVTFVVARLTAGAAPGAANVTMDQPCFWMARNKPVLYVGVAGAGKTVIVKDYI